MPEHSSKRAGQRGSALVLFTVMLTVLLLPMIGLAIDGGFVYFAHARLVAAADAGALAGARSLSVGMDLSSQAANAQAIATKYVQANIPSGLLNTSSLSVPLPSVTETSAHVRTVSVNPSMTIGLYFMGIIGHPNTTIAAFAKSSRRDVNIVLAIDKSNSMSGVCGIMKSDAENFVSKFAEGRDAVGLISFMGNANVDVVASTTFQSAIATDLASLTCGGNTGSAAALYLAHDQITKIAQPGALNVIVFFTDGMPNGYSAAYPIKKNSSCNKGKPVTGYIAENGGIFSTDVSDNGSRTQNISGCSMGNLGGLGNSFSFIPEQDIYGNAARGSYVSIPSGPIAFSTATSDAASINAADYAAQQARADGIIVYTIGLDGNGGVDGTLLKRIANDAASSIHNSAQPTGKYYYSPNAGQLASVWNSVASEIIRISQ